MRRKITSKCLVFLFAAGLAALPCPAQTGKLPVRLEVMKGELQRNFESLKEEESPPYYISYSIDQVRSQSVSGSYGAIINRDDSETAHLRIDVRVGSHRLDNTHEIRGDRFARFMRFFQGTDVAPLRESPEALKLLLWQGTDKAFKEAVETLEKIKTDKSLMVDEEDQSDDFSTVESHVSIEEPLDIRVDLDKWTSKIRKFSEPFKGNPHILEARASFRSEVRNKYFIDTDGTVLMTPTNYMRLMIAATSKAEDGMELPLYKSYFGFRESDLPPDDAVMDDVKEMIGILEELRTAPLVEPYTGPAILAGRASGVFFHEILGHRLEGHRQKSEEEGQTFKKKVNEKVLPEFMSVIFDPTIKEKEGLKLSGYYKFDDEGTKAEKVVAIENGIMKNFLMSRSPIENFPKSNGHARCQPGLKPVSRQSNLIVESKKRLSEKGLRKMLIEECKKQEKPFGLVFTDIQGGFTMTGRRAPNAFAVLPLVVYKINMDGGPDELIRGVDLIGTPLTTFGKIIATGTEVEVFNGTCGAESGAVPVSAVSPSILVSQIEVQKKAKSQEKPPILPPPTIE